MTTRSQQPAAVAPAAPQGPKPLFFRETFKEKDSPQAPAGFEVFTPERGSNPNLEITLYGRGARLAPDGHESGLQLYYQQDPFSNGPIAFVWSGMTEGNWAITVKDKAHFVDLSGNAMIRWRVRMRGFNELRPIVKLADGTMLAGDYTEPMSTHWRQSEFYLVDVPRWRVLDQKEIIAAANTGWQATLDLSKVDEVGFTDLMRGAGHGMGGASGIDWIEVYGTPVKRAN
jgi:hypothetical protein